jgi:predicted porin
LAAVYSGGPVYATVAYETQNKGFGQSGGDPVTGTRLGVGYDLKATGTKLGLVYEMIKDDAANSIATRNAWNLAVTQKLGNETLKLAYGVADDGESTATTGASRIAVGVDHKMSKRTTAYVLYAQTTNDDGSRYGVGQGGAGGAYRPDVAGDSPSVISIGLNHSF